MPNDPSVGSPEECRLGHESIEEFYRRKVVERVCGMERNPEDFGPFELLSNVLDKLDEQTKNVDALSDAVKALVREQSGDLGGK